MTNGEIVAEIIEAAVAQGQVPGVVAAVAQGDATSVKAAGNMALGGAPMREDTVFRISSMTKPVTAAVILGLVEDGAPGPDGCDVHPGPGSASAATAAGGTAGPCSPTAATPGRAGSARPGSTSRTRI